MIDKRILTVFRFGSVLPPHSVGRAAVLVPVGIEQRHDDPVHVTHVSVQHPVLRGGEGLDESVDHVKAGGRRDPFSCMDSCNGSLSSCHQVTFRVLCTHIRQMQTRVDPDCLPLCRISSRVVTDLDEHEISPFFSGPFLGESNDVRMKVGLLLKVPHPTIITA